MTAEKRHLYAIEHLVAPVEAEGEFGAEEDNGHVILTSEINCKKWQTENPLVSI